MASKQTPKKTEGEGEYNIIVYFLYFSRNVNFSSSRIAAIAVLTVLTAIW